MATTSTQRPSIDRREIRSLRAKAAKEWGIGFALAWAFGSALSCGNPGDEYGMFFLGCFLGIPGAFIAGLVGAHSVEGMMLGVVVFGSTVTGFLGSVLGRQQARLGPWIAVWAALALAIGMVTILQYDSLAHAESKNGSLLTYFWFGGMVSFSATMVVAAAVIGGGRARPLRRAVASTETARP